MDIGTKCQQAFIPVITSNYLDCLLHLTLTYSQEEEDDDRIGGKWEIQMFKAVLIY